jgi:hypothetical protein
MRDGGKDSSLRGLKARGNPVKWFILKIKENSVGFACLCDIVLASKVVQRDEKALYENFGPKGLGIGKPIFQDNQ